MAFDPEKALERIQGKRRPLTTDMSTALSRTRVERHPLYPEIPPGSLVSLGKGIMVRIHISNSGQIRKPFGRLAKPIVGVYTGKHTPEGMTIRAQNQSHLIQSDGQHEPIQKDDIIYAQRESIVVCPTG